MGALSQAVRFPGGMSDAQTLFAQFIDRIDKRRGEIEAGDGGPIPALAAPLGSRLVARDGEPVLVVLLADLRVFYQGRKLLRAHHHSATIYQAGGQRSSQEWLPRCIKSFQGKISP
eukprot:scaffold132734_cov27-Prasinocladus_malaysianus.AAC.1